MNNVSGFCLSDIQANAEIFDSEQLHAYIISQVDAREYDTCLEALSVYAEEHDMDMTTIKKYISPVLKGILYKEACERNLINNPTISNIPESFFV